MLLLTITILNVKVYSISFILMFPSLNVAHPVRLMYLDLLFLTCAS